MSGWSCGSALLSGYQSALIESWSGAAKSRGTNYRPGLRVRHGQPAVLLPELDGIGPAERLAAADGTADLISRQEEQTPFLPVGTTPGDGWFVRSAAG